MRVGLTAAELETRLAAEFPEAFYPGNGLTIVEARPRAARLRLVPAANSIRPGGTIAGPTLMMLADVAMYIAVLASVTIWADGDDEPVAHATSTYSIPPRGK